MALPLVGAVRGGRVVARVVAIGRGGERPSPVPIKSPPVLGRPFPLGHGPRPSPPFGIDRVGAKGMSPLGPRFNPLLVGRPKELQDLPCKGRVAPPLVEEDFIGLQKLESGDSLSVRLSVPLLRRCQDSGPSGVHAGHAGLSSHVLRYGANHVADVAVGHRSLGGGSWGPEWGGGFGRPSAAGRRRLAVGIPGADAVLLDGIAAAAVATAGAGREGELAPCPCPGAGGGRGSEGAPALRQGRRSRLQALGGPRGPRGRFLRHVARSAPGRGNLLLEAPRPFASGLPLSDSPAPAPAGALSFRFGGASHAAVSRDPRLAEMEIVPKTVSIVGSFS